MDCLLLLSIRKIVKEKLKLMTQQAEISKAKVKNIIWSNINESHLKCKAIFKTVVVRVPFLQALFLEIYVGFRIILQGAKYGRQSGKRRDAIG